MAAEDIESSLVSATGPSNTAASPNGEPSGSSPSIVYTFARELQAKVRRLWDRIGPTQTSGGSANAQTLTFSPASLIYKAGQRYSFIAGATNTGAMTLNVDTLGTKAVQLGAAALTGGEIVSGQMVEVAYDGTAFQILALPGHYRGGLIGIQIFDTAGTFTYTPTVGTNAVEPEVVGAGGGGGGCATTSSSQVAMGSPGGAGGYARKRFTSSFAGVTVTVGAKGAGGSAGANNGTAGGSSSFGALLSATGGPAGFAGSAVGVPAIAFAASAVGVGSSGAPNAAGGKGGISIAANATTVAAGSGGASYFGGGAVGADTTGGAAGNAATSPGAGGSGGNNTQSQATPRAGGAGGDGYVIVKEYG